MLKLLLLPLFLILLSCNSERNSEEKRIKEKDFVVVSVMPLKAVKVKVFYEAKGSFESFKEVVVKPEVSGLVEKIFVEEGDRVEKGEKLLKIEDSFLQISLKRLKALYEKTLADYNYYKAFYQRRIKLFEKELIAKESLEEAKRRYEAYERELKALKAQIEDIRLRIKKSFVKAPFNGYIAKRYISEGDYVTSTSKLFHVVQLKPLRLKFSLPQELIGRVDTGFEVYAYVKGAGDFKGEVFFISPVLSPDRMVEVKALFKNREEILKPGMYALVRIPIGERKGFKIPEKALSLMGNKKVVWKLIGNEVQPVEVEILKQEGNYLFVDGKLKEGDKVVVENVHLLSPGKKVVVK